MKKIFFFFIFSLFLTSCATNGCIGKGYGSATKEKNVQKRVTITRYNNKIEEVTFAKTTNRSPKSNGCYSNLGAKPPKPTKSNVE